MNKSGLFISFVVWFSFYSGFKVTFDDGKRREGEERHVLAFVASACFEFLTHMHFKARQGGRGESNDRLHF
jgi:hypothetical protein